MRNRIQCVLLLLLLLLAGCVKTWIGSKGDGVPLMIVNATQDTITRVELRVIGAQGKDLVLGPGDSTTLYLRGDPAEYGIDTLAFYTRDARGERLIAESSYRSESLKMRQPTQVVVIGGSTENVATANRTPTPVGYLRVDIVDRAAQRQAKDLAAQRAEESAAKDCDPMFTAARWHAAPRANAGSR